MWDKVLTAFTQTLDKAEATYLGKARSKLTFYQIDWLISDDSIRLQLYG